ncbi:hypothetical protein G6321_00029285 [Bradyrhizobium barranii subsp. barranii]|uniref:Uncharacterized protein n=1 Tax=Bradyrhizobium barranii subsp. barranii TaxID=2823807 RepID=A0A7Z0QK47_9BRAD|nr:hypothetical protein [Bradyrhizobium barranii]UGX89948.1 hypothetical protein G6321_00029285 [Bradyrhizobium barranii subsp. barranii]
MSKVSPLYPTKRTSVKGVVTSLMGQKATLTAAGKHSMRDGEPRVKADPPYAA